MPTKKIKPVIEEAEAPTKEERESARPIAELNIKTQEYLLTIFKKEPYELTAADLAFLKGRRDYLTKEQRKDYGVDKDKTPKRVPNAEDDGARD